MSRTLVCQKWTESERGWGQRPDGYSLHVDDNARKAFIAEYWARMPDETPDEYSRPDGTPYACPVTQALFDTVAALKNGLRHYSGPAPWPGGEDGWRSENPPRLDGDEPKVVEPAEVESEPDSAMVERARMFVSNHGESLAMLMARFAASEIAAALKAQK